MTFKNFNELLEVARKEKPKEGFACVASNPPYQISVSNNSSMQIYGNFYTISKLIGDYISMVFPKGWLYSSGAGSGSSHHVEMRADPGLISVNCFNEDRSSPVILFEGAGTGGVNIVFRKSDHNNGGFVDYYEHSNFIEKRDLSNHLYWSSEAQNIFDIIEAWIDKNNLSRMSAREWTNKVPFGLRTYILRDKDRDEFKYVDSPDGGIKFYGKDNKWGYHTISRNAPFLKTENIDRWKAAWSKTGAENNYRQAMVIEPGVIFAEQMQGIFFDSELHTKNFITYFRTNLYRFCLSTRALDRHAGRKLHIVPDLVSVTNPRTGLIGYESDWTNEDLKKLFEDVLTEEDWTYIEKVAIESDPVGRRSE